MVVRKKNPASSGSGKKPKRGRAERNFQEIQQRYEIQPGMHFERLFLGVLLVFLGLFLLARNTGWIPAEFRIDFWKLWPVLLVYVGLSNLKLRAFFGVLLGVTVTFLVAGLVGLFLLTAS